MTIHGFFSGLQEVEAQAQKNYTLSRVKSQYWEFLGDEEILHDEKGRE